MNKITKRMEEIIVREKISETSSLLYGTNIPKVKSVIPTPWNTFVNFENIEIYFYYFDEKGITLFSFNREEKLFISWNEIQEFKVNQLLIYRLMIIKVNNQIYKFQISNRVFGCPWIKDNIRYLEGNNYFYENIIK